jgi:hypothetical protein
VDQINTSTICEKAGEKKSPGSDEEIIKTNTNATTTPARQTAGVSLF